MMYWSIDWLFIYLSYLFTNIDHVDSLELRTSNFQTYTAIYKADLAWTPILFST